MPAKKGCIPWNKGKRGLQKHSETTKEKLRLTSTGKAKTPELEAERIRKITEKARQKNGGLRRGSGRGKKGWYRGIFCDSSWELALVLYCTDNDIKIEKCKEVRKYLWNGKERKYYPDFIIDNKIVEIKGFRTKQWEEKIKYNSDVLVLYKKDMTMYLEHAISKYGKDFTKVYGG